MMMQLCLVVRQRLGRRARNCHEKRRGCLICVGRIDKHAARTRMPGGQEGETKDEACTFTQDSSSGRGTAR